ncbi:MAG: Fis family transcriptional regulator [Burkholderiaceae bacterium]|nr:Fis family transcriptional regulator [Burkholderiaceae bacterium]
MHSNEINAANAMRLQFPNTAHERTARARALFFEHGERPSGLVGEAVIQSWLRCVRAWPDPRKAVALDPVSTSRIHAARERGRALLDAAQAPVQAMERAIGGTGAHVLLTNADGVVLYATPSPTGSRTLTRRIGRPGVNAAEGCLGTNAPAVVLATGQACLVTAAEHYFDALREMHCAAAPIRDASGALAAVLNVSVEGRAFAFNPGAIVGLYATVIENALLQALARDQLVLQFQTQPGLLGSPLQALAAVASDGTLAWCNDSAAHLLGCDARLPRPMDVSAVLGLPLSQLESLTRQTQPRELRLINGIRVWVSARLGAVGAPQATALGSAPVAPAVRATPMPQQAVEPAPADARDNDGQGDGEHAATLRMRNLQLIHETLTQQRGNVQRTARILGISRSTLYRRLNESRSARRAPPA